MCIMTPTALFALKHTRVRHLVAVYNERNVYSTSTMNWITLMCALFFLTRTCTCDLIPKLNQAFSNNHFPLREPLRTRNEIPFCCRLYDTSYRWLWVDGNNKIFRNLELQAISAQKWNRAEENQENSGNTTIGVQKA